jgi:hypothetical protein
LVAVIYFFGGHYGLNSDPALTATGMKLAELLRSNVVVAAAAWNPLSSFFFLWAITKLHDRAIDWTNVRRMSKARRKSVTAPLKLRGEIVLLLIGRSNGPKDIEIKIHKGKRKQKTLLISKGNIEWNPVSKRVEKYRDWAGPVWQS